MGTWAKWRWPIRVAVYTRDEFRCLRCGWQSPDGLPPTDYDGSYAVSYRPEHGPILMLTLDHIVPASQGGAFTVDNLQTLCNPCNSAKAGSATDYRKAVADAA